MFHDYRQVLKDQFFERRARNPSYSLRAYARDLGVAAPNLSMVLKEKKGMNLVTARKIAKRLGLSEAEQTLFCDLVEKEHARSPIARQQALKTVELKTGPHLQSNLTADVWQIVGSWHYFAIIEWLRMRASSQHLEDLSSAIGISLTDARDAVEKLLKVGLLEKKAAKLVPAHQFNWSPDGIPSEVTRRGHDRMLDKAKEALFSQSVDERDFTYMTFGMDSNDLPAAKKEIRAFMRTFLDKYSNKKTATEVYTLNTQIFNLTPNRNRKNS